MRKYPQSHWQALGNYVNLVRHQAGFSDMRKWADEVGRSSRVLLGLERGEPVGAKTIEAVAEALGISNWSLFSVLDTGDPEGGARVGWTDDQIEAARKSWEQETGLEADDGGSGSTLTYVSDDDLLAEVARRLAARWWTTRGHRIAIDVSTDCSFPAVPEP